MINYVIIQYKSIINSFLKYVKIINYNKTYNI